MSFWDRGKRAIAMKEIEKGFMQNRRKPFRTYREMRDVYAQMENLPGKGLPYVVKFQDEGRYFGVIGTSHTNDPGHLQWEGYRLEWEQFLASLNTEKIVMYEGRSSFPDADNDFDALSKGADSGYTRWLAEKNGLQTMSPELDRAAEIEYVKGLGFSEDDIVVYYTGRQLSQWKRYDHQIAPNLQDYLERTLTYTAKYAPWMQRYSIDDVVVLLRQATDTEELVHATGSALSNIADPSLNAVSSASSDFRNECIFKVLHEAWSEGKDVFCVYGSGHAIVLEPAIDEMFKGQGKIEV